MSFRQRGFDGGALLCETQGAMNGGPLSGVQEALRILRERKHLSQREAASRAGMDSGGLSKIESGKQSLRVATLDKLLAVYDADLLDLQHALTGEPPFPSPPPPPVNTGADEPVDRLRVLKAIEQLAANQRWKELQEIAMSGKLPDLQRAGETLGRVDKGKAPVRGKAARGNGS
jgi:transcriptional regulator with XRE-family HTH domain